MTPLTDNQIAALKGELSEKDYIEEGMGLFQKGLVHLDPTIGGARAFPISAKGRKVALELRAK